MNRRFTGRPRAWRKTGTVPVYRGRDAEMDADDEAKRWQDLAPTFGWCGSCGVTVDEPNGKLHAHDCPYLPEERRKPA